MKNDSGSNSGNMKSGNRSLVLKLLCTNPPLYRGEIAQKTGLTKMTASNIVSELLAMGIVSESKPSASQSAAGAGRIPGLINIANTSPCICGMFIGRKHCSVLFSDYKANVFARQDTQYPDDLDAKKLVSILTESFYRLKASCHRDIIGLGISSLGPLNAAAGTILKPPFFYHISNLPILDILKKETGLPGMLINDCSAGALAEKLYGDGTDLSNFAYLQIQDGIGAGLVVNDSLFDGDIGLGGEIGHTTINFMGPRCDCGNFGCLELYANEHTLTEQVQKLLEHGGESVLSGNPKPTWSTIVNAADRGDRIAISALDAFCEYVSFALVNYLNLLDSHVVIIGYDGNGKNHVIEKALERKINEKLLASEYRSVQVRRSRFQNAAPIIGSVALVAQKMFSGEWPFSVE
jgi:transcriptional regulator of PTS gene